MTESIHIRNVGPLKDICLENIPPLTVLIGESGSGKSLLMKTIILMRFIYKRMNVRAFLLNSGIKRSPFRIRFDSLLHDDMRFYLTKPEAEIEYNISFPSGNSYFIKLANRKITQSRSIKNSDLIFSKEAWVSETRNIIPSWKANPANSRGWLGFYFHETMNDFDEAAAWVKSVDMDFINARMAVSTVNGTRRFMLSVHDKHEPIELRFASSGMQTVAPLAMLTQYFAKSFSFKDAKRRSVLSYLYEGDQLTDFHPKIELADIDTVINMHVEEPELSLDPISQIRLLEFLVAHGFSRASNQMTMMLATHSPYIVNALNLIINRKKEDARMDVSCIGAYRLSGGQLINLISSDDSGRPLVDTSDLTAPMESILEEYQNIIAMETK